MISDVTCRGLLRFARYSALINVFLMVLLGRYFDAFIFMLAAIACDGWYRAETKAVREARTSEWLVRQLLTTPKGRGNG